ncbi:hypothetical protein FE634_10875 [Nocardioides dongxiaopingii]|uniref:hypothetical protein n=1 Tax=Nocardioides sp. S-1144 TaxID=2582905 RepID=UPI00110D53B0|nr:hypothetical protein [Nocardioides sp. S-1144]QCW50788.1 hypothetical protein FE634_10875 [Nocardioides sp. S-1144]
MISGLPPRVDALAEVDPTAAGRVLTLLDRAPDAIAAAYLPETGEMAQTVRGVPGPDGVELRAEGTNLRYAAMAALGLARVPEAVQRRTLAGRSARDLAASVTERARTDADPGAVALAAWASAEVGGDPDTELLGRCRAALDADAPITTVALAWTVVAAVAAHDRADTAELLDLAVTRLRVQAGEAGIFPHVVPASSQPRWRRHVGSFADSIYPVQALARAAALTGDRPALWLAERSAARLCTLQGEHGQWWWHYDVRDGEVVERYPVYSVHQHSMAPMVLMDLADAGGPDRRAEIAAGVHWLDRHPEVVEDVVHERHRLVWRKVGRREPPKAARGLSAVTTAVRPGWTAPGVDRWLLPRVVDHECRPYEPAWLLHGWLAPAGATT